MIHELKTINPFFTEVLVGRKKFELHFNDRNYKVGDSLLLKEFERGEFTGKSLSLSIGCIIDKNSTGKLWCDMPEGLEKNYVIISEKMDDFLISDSYRHVGDKMLLLSPNNNKWEYYEILYRISHENFPDGIKQGYFIYSISK